MYVLTIFTAWVMEDRSFSRTLLAASLSAATQECFRGYLVYDFRIPLIKTSSAIKYILWENSSNGSLSCCLINCNCPRANTGTSFVLKRLRMSALKTLYSTLVLWTWRVYSNAESVKQSNNLHVFVSPVDPLWPAVRSNWYMNASKVGFPEPLNSGILGGFGSSSSIFWPAWVFLIKRLVIRRIYVFSTVSFPFPSSRLSTYFLSSTVCNDMRSFMSQRCTSRLLPSSNW